MLSMLRIGVWVEKAWFNACCLWMWIKNVMQFAKNTECECGKKSYLFCVCHPVWFITTTNSQITHIRNETKDCLFWNQCWNEPLALSLRALCDTKWMKEIGKKRCQWNKWIGTKKHETFAGKKWTIRYQRSGGSGWWKGLCVYCVNYQFGCRRFSLFHSHFQFGYNTWSGMIWIRPF